RRRHERYVLDVPANTLLRAVVTRPDGRRPPFERADAWAARQPASGWKPITVRDGAQGPLIVRALKGRGQSRREGGHVGPTAASTAGKTPAATPPQVQQIFSALPRDPPPEPEQIAEQVDRVLQRNEESPIYAWYHQTKTFPPRPLIPNGAAAAPKKKRLQ